MKNLSIGFEEAESSESLVYADSDRRNIES